MDYEGLSRDDLDNVTALNREWLRLAREDDAGLAGLAGKRLERLAEAPFLLFSYRENDAALWQALLDGAPQRDLFSERTDAAKLELQGAGLGFLWNLARRNPFVVRVVGGAPLAWCERIANTTMLRLSRCARHGDLIVPRFASQSPEFRRLAIRGSSSLHEARRFAHMTALQSLLTRGESAECGRLPAAACRIVEPSRRIVSKV